MDQCDEFVLWILYDNYRLWFVSLLDIQNMPALYLEFDLGSDFKQRKLSDLLDFIDGVDRNLVTAGQDLRGSRLGYWYPGLQATPAGDY